MLWVYCNFITHKIKVENFTKDALLWKWSLKQKEIVIKKQTRFPVFKGIKLECPTWKCHLRGKKYMKKDFYGSIIFWRRDHGYRAIDNQPLHLCNVSGIIIFRNKIISKKRNLLLKSTKSFFETKSWQKARKRCHTRTRNLKLRKQL